MNQMEIFDKDKIEKKKEVKMAACPECGNTFPFRSNKKYCSNSCRTKASILRSALGTERPTINSNAGSYVPMNGLNAQSQYIIDHQKKEVQRWENKYEEERKTRKKIQEDNQKLRDELAQIKVDQKINESAKPSGLSGFLESPFLQQLAPHIGPVIGDFAKRFLVADTATGGNDLMVWVSSLPPEIQENFIAMVQELAKMQDPELLNSTINKLLNFLTHGIAATTKVPTAQFSANASAAM